MTKEEQIKNFMEKLHISYEEAEQLFEDDSDDFIGEEGEAMTEKAKANVKNYVGGDKKEKKPREKKIDEEKKTIIELLKNCLIENGYNATIVNVDKAIDFDCYTLNLVKHRPPKNGGKG